MENHLVAFRRFASQLRNFNQKEKSPTESMHGAHRTARYISCSWPLHDGAVQQLKESLARRPPAILAVAARASRRSSWRRQCNGRTTDRVPIQALPAPAARALLAMPRRAGVRSQIVHTRNGCGVAACDQWTSRQVHLLVRYFFLTQSSWLAI